LAHILGVTREAGKGDEEEGRIKFEAITGNLLDLAEKG
jgi:hypothetical protein